MVIVLDWHSCSCWEPACETHFGWYFLREEVTPIDCTVEMVDDGKPETTFYIMNRDVEDKILVVDETYRAAACDSWLVAWEEQQSGKPRDTAVD